MGQYFLDTQYFTPNESSVISGKDYISPVDIFKGTYLKIGNPQSSRLFNNTEVETNKFCVVPFLRSSGALRGVVKDKRSCSSAWAEKVNMYYIPLYLAYSYPGPVRNKLSCCLYVCRRGGLSRSHNEHMVAHLFPPLFLAYSYPCEKLTELLLICRRGELCRSHNEHMVVHLYPPLFLAYSYPCEK